MQPQQRSPLVLSVVLGLLCLAPRVAHGVAFDGMVCTEIVKGAKFETPEGAYEVVCASAKNVVAILTTADGQRTMTRVPRGKFDATVRNGLSAGIPAVVEIPNVRTETDRYARMMMHDAMLYGTDRPLNRWALVWAIV